MTQDKPFFSVVVPSYNRADLIGDTIRSLQQQEYPDFEIIVVDDGSTDNTEEVVLGMADARTFFYRKDNAERAAARNYGARKGKGSYINFFDSDDIALPNHLSEAAKLVEQKGQPEWLHLGYCWADPDRKVFRKIDNLSGETLNRLLPLGNPLSCNSVFVRKDIMMANPFNETRDLSASEDYELWLRLGAKFPLHYTNTITSLIIDHEGRSVRKINYEKLILRFELLMQAIASNKEVMDAYGKQYSYMKMDANSYIAVHLADRPGYKLKSVGYLAKALGDDYRLMTTKRFFATIKNLILKW